jgi:hypothetical protein
VVNERLAATTRRYVAAEEQFLAAILKDVIVEDGLDHIRVASAEKKAAARAYVEDLGLDGFSGPYGVGD